MSDFDGKDIQIVADLIIFPADQAINRLMLSVATPNLIVFANFGIFVLKKVWQTTYCISM